MTLRDETIRARPDFPWLDVADPAGVERLMRRLGWLVEGESIASCQIAGPGNMNLTLRIQTARRECILKQARPWVEKFDHIPAPWDRASNEIAFYRAAAEHPALRARMPVLLGFDEASHTLLLEYLEGDGDFSDLYGTGLGGISRRLNDADLRTAAGFLAYLHGLPLPRESQRIVNREMRALNYEHIFEIPLREDSGIDLEPLAEGLGDAASSLREDLEYRDIVAETGRAYLSAGPCLLHGDFFPGSWLRSRDGLRVIDPEFCFHGVPEFDLGCAVAHFALARQPLAASRTFLDHYHANADGVAIRGTWVARFAGIEVMRRLIGVAQLPLPDETVLHAGEAPRPFRTALLERSGRAVVRGDIAWLWNPE